MSLTEFSRGCVVLFLKQMIKVAQVMKPALFADVYDFFFGLRQKINGIFQSFVVNIIGGCHAENTSKNAAQVIAAACGQLKHARKPQLQIFKFIHLSQHFVKPDGTLAVFLYSFFVLKKIVHENGREITGGVQGGVRRLSAFHLRTDFL